MNRFFTAVLLGGLTVVCGGCSGGANRTTATETGAVSQDEVFAQEEGWALEDDGEPLPVADAPRLARESLVRENVGLAQPPQPRNPFDTWENRQFRRITTPAQR